MIPKVDPYSERLQFRPLSTADVPQLFAIYSDSEAMQHRGSGHMSTISEAVAFVDNQHRIENTVHTIRRGVELKVGPELIGSVMYKYDLATPTECEIDYSIGAAYWGRGLGREILGLLVDAMEQVGQVPRLLAWTKKANLASIRILEINGFVREEQSELADCFLYVKDLTSR